MNRDGYVRFEFDEKTKNEIVHILNEVAVMYNEGMKAISSIMDNVIAAGVLKKQLRLNVNDIFENDADIIYIPAGRSLLATLSEQLYDLSLSEMDLTMQEFINLIRITKNKFGSKIPEIAKNYTKTVKGQINNTAVSQAYELIKKIFKADYTSENDGEKIYFDEKHWVKLMYGSSGQQEVLWILMLAFINILENKKCFVVIEEPEAHLFPVAQKDVIELIALMINTTGSKAIITTHSPYILTSMNILLYSHKVENAVKCNDSVVLKNMRVSYKEFAAYRVSKNAERKNVVESLMDEESQMINTNYIDEVSLITNEELEKLISMEIMNDL